MTEFPKPPPPPKWATFIADRKPQFKMHSNWGHVRNAIGSGWSGRARGGRVYEWQGDDWVLIWDVPYGVAKATHEFFVGMRGGPQDVEKMARREKLEKERRKAALLRELEELEKS